MGKVGEQVVYTLIHTPTHRHTHTHTHTMAVGYGKMFNLLVFKETVIQTAMRYWEVFCLMNLQRLFQMIIFILARAWELSPPVACWWGRRLVPAFRRAV